MYWLAQFCVHSPERFKAGCSVMTRRVAATRSPRLDSVDSQVRVWRQQPNAARHAAICWRFGEPQSAAVDAHLSIRLPELGARGAYRASPSQIYKQTALRANKLSDKQSKLINELFFCDVMPFSLVDMYRRVVGACCPQLQRRWSTLMTAATCFSTSLPDCTVSKACLYNWHMPSA